MIPEKACGKRIGMCQVEKGKAFQEQEQHKQRLEVGNHGVWRTFVSLVKSLPGEGPFHS